MLSLRRSVGILAALLIVAAAAPAARARQGLSPDLQAEHDPVRRLEKALVLADEAFDGARDAYSKGQIKQGDALLEEMTTVLKHHVGFLENARKARYSKKAELHVAALQRRLQDLVESLDLTDRGWAEYTARKLDEIHDELLTGVMRK